MPITRDEAFPAEAAQLVAMLNQCCDGHTLEHVEMAVTNIFSAVVVQGATDRQLKGVNRDRHISRMIAQALRITMANLDRQPSATDIKVESN